MGCRIVLKVVCDGVRDGEDDMKREKDLVREGVPYNRL